MALGGLTAVPAAADDVDLLMEMPGATAETAAANAEAAGDDAAYLSTVPNVTCDIAPVAGWGSAQVVIPDVATTNAHDAAGASAQCNSRDVLINYTMTLTVTFQYRVPGPDDLWEQVPAATVATCTQPSGSRSGSHRQVF